MPTYDYTCSSCGRTTEIVHSINSGPPTACPACGAEGTLRKEFNPPTIHFKGSGWAKKDRSSASTKAARSAELAGSSSSGSGSPSSTASAEGGSRDSSAGGSDGSSGGSDGSSSGSDGDGHDGKKAATDSGRTTGKDGGSDAGKGAGSTSTTGDRPNRKVATPATSSTD